MAFSSSFTVYMTGVFANTRSGWVWLAWVWVYKSWGSNRYTYGFGNIVSIFNNLLRTDATGVRWVPEGWDPLGHHAHGIRWKSETRSVRDSRWPSAQLAVYVPTIRIQRILNIMQGVALTSDFFLLLLFCSISRCAEVT